MAGAPWSRYCAASVGVAGSRARATTAGVARGLARRAGLRVLAGAAVVVKQGPRPV